jgi:hypothetical protein
LTHFAKAPFVQNSVIQLIRILIATAHEYNAFYNEKRKIWDGLRTFPWREFGVMIKELIPFAG